MSGAEGKFVAYYRVSTARQGRSGLGLDAQRAAVAAYLRGVDPVASFTEVESGKNNDRPELARALAACRLYGAKLVIAKLDRLSRNAAFLLTLRDGGVRFVAADMPDANEMTIGILAVVAQHEREQISARTKAALQAAKARGRKLGNSKNLSNRDVGSERGGIATAAKAKARAKDIGVELARLRAEGATTVQLLAEALNREGIPTTRGGKWHPTQVQRVLTRLRAEGGR